VTPSPAPARSSAAAPLPAPAPASTAARACGSTAAGDGGGRPVGVGEWRGGGDLDRRVGDSRGDGFAWRSGSGLATDGRAFFFFFSFFRRFTEFLFCFAREVRTSLGRAHCSLF